MICPFCKAEGETSRLTPSSVVSSTCMASSPGHYDERGAWVAGRDPNWHTRTYSCSRGHVYRIRSREGYPDEVTLAAYPPKEVAP